jgi:hypothetical protein
MKPGGKMSSIRVANTVYEGQQINGQTQRREEERREEKRREIKTQIKEDPSSRSKEEPGPLRDTTSEGPSTL